MSRESQPGLSTLAETAPHAEVRDAKSWADLRPTRNSRGVAINPVSANPNVTEPPFGTFVLLLTVLTDLPNVIPYLLKKSSRGLMSANSIACLRRLLQY
ncbi:MAG: hypothetical protein QW543_05345 [Sulfolobales archaeon]